jgi:hypothetical protein
MVCRAEPYEIGEPAGELRAQDSMEAAMATLIVLFAIVVVSGILLGGFAAACRSIRRTDKWGTLRPEAPALQRPIFSFASRWDDNTPAAFA